MTQPANFTHLHVHTQYSLLDGACRVKELIQKAVEYKMPAIAMTDHGNMFGAIDFYQTAMSLAYCILLSQSNIRYLK